MRAARSFLSTFAYRAKLSALMPFGGGQWRSRPEAIFWDYGPLARAYGTLPVHL